MTQPFTLVGIIVVIVAMAFVATLVGCSGPNRLAPEREVSPAQEQCRVVGKGDC